MSIGSLIIEAMIYNAQSLKQKRSVTKSVAARLKQRLNVSIAEINHQDVWQRTEWAIVSVSAEKKQAEKELQKAISILETYNDLEITNITWEWL
ncbi:DUF503 domain-containing protein [Salipaludibacillus aurantiacus]|uniref:YlxP-like protein n=1 Tax=Salipaludibacillus aurantiacus TaxID=1601833 RepID=A0A1H9QH05_9BACI|nr:DUF503 domain-containing protein [Salipaludibacillus aurantiacus]SER59722.1 hypothetical protein SAMN05518684_102223 [Salipaludibacillus aurantiacus]